MLTIQVGTKKEDGGQDDDKNIIYNDDVEHDEVDDLNEDLFHPRNGLGDNINDDNNKLQYIEEGGILNENKGQGNHFGNAKNTPLSNNIPLGQNEHFGGVDNIDNDNNENNDIDNKNQNHGENNHNQISDDDSAGNASYDNDDFYDGIPKDNHQHAHDPPEGGDHNPEYKEHENNNVDEPGNDGQDANDIKQVEEDDDVGRRRRSRQSITHSLPGANKKDTLDGDYCNRLASHICPLVGVMAMAKQAEVQMMKEYFKIELSKSTPQYGFRKGLQLFKDKGYQDAKTELEKNLLGRGCIDMLPRKGLMRDIQKRALGYLMFLKRKRSEKMKGRGCANGCPQRYHIIKEESSLPTVLLYALMDSCVMDALDDRKVITVDIPSAFLQEK